MEGDWTRSATWGSNPKDFYPRPHMEGDCDGMTAILLDTDFYPRPHMEGDGAKPGTNDPVVDFYPRPHMEGDTSPFMCHSGCPPISTHALTWRATGYYRLTDLNYGNFYPRPHMEGDALLPPAYPYRRNFYPRPHMEGDRVHRGLPLDAVGISTHALTWRATLVDGK